MVRYRRYQDGLEAIREDICKACAAGNSFWLYHLLTSFEGQDVSRSWRVPGQIAARHGHVKCLNVLHHDGYVFDILPWCCAAEHGQIQCLQFAVNQGYELDDRVVHAAMRSGRLACLDFLMQQGLPDWPYLQVDFPLTPDQLKCMEMMLDKGVALHPGNLMMAAGHGDVDCVRALHKRGWPLWQEIRYRMDTSGRQCTTEGPGALVIHPRPHYREAIWKAMRYASLHGAPVTRPLEKMFRWKQQRTHAVLCCFKAADRLSKRPGAAGALASMAAVPTELVDMIIVSADLEIAEIVMKGPARQSAPAGAQ